MKVLFDSVLINRIQMESNSNEVQLFCTVYEQGASYEKESFISMSAFNQLLCEFDVRGIQIDMENGWDFIQTSEDEYIYTMDLYNLVQQPVFLPLVCLPKENRLLRA